MESKRISMAVFMVFMIVASAENDKATTMGVHLKSLEECMPKCDQSCGGSAACVLGCGFSCAVSLADSMAATTNPLRSKENDDASTVDVDLNSFQDCYDKCKENCYTPTPACLLKCAVKCSVVPPDSSAQTN